MDVTVYNLNGEPAQTLAVKHIFADAVRTDLIKRAVRAEQANRRQPYGTDPLAGKRTSAHYHGRRGIYRTMMNREMARMKRIHTMGFLNFRARFVPQATKGRKAHPPTTEKDYTLKINQKEHKKALYAALAASVDTDMLSKRGHIITGLTIPLIIEDSFEGLKKNKDVTTVLAKLGLAKELHRSAQRHIRAGTGTRRGRTSRTRKGPLIIIGKDQGIRKASRNIPGVDMVAARNLSVTDLAPGAHPGRLCIFTHSALAELEKAR